MTNEQFQQFVIDELKSIRSNISQLQKDIEFIKGRLESKIESRTAFIAWTGLIIAVGTLIWKLLGDN